MTTRSLYISLAIAGIMSVAPVHGQIRSLQGVIGGEFEQYDFTEFGSRRINNYYRQLASISLQGNAYNHNLVDFTLQTRILNSNASLRSGGGKTNEHSLFISFYDISVILLKKTKLPVSFYLRRDVQSNESSGNIPWAFSNRILTTAGGGQLSYSFNNGSLPTMTLGYHRYNSESVVPGFQFAQQNAEYELGFFQTIGKTTLSVNGLVNDRYDRINRNRQTLRETRLQQHTSLGGTDQLLSNAVWQVVGNLHRVDGTSIWNARFTSSTQNQSTLTYHWLQSPGFSNIDLGVRDQFEVGLSDEWRARITGSLSQGRIHSRGGSRATSSSSLGSGVTYQVVLDRIRPTINVQADYLRRTGDFQYHQLGGFVSAGLSSVNVRFIDLSVGDQIGITGTTNGDSYSTVTNMLNASASTSVIPDVTLNGYTTYTTSRDIGHTITLDRSDLRATFNATYQWSFLMRMYLRGGITTMRQNTTYYRQTLHQYSYEVLVPALAPNLQFTFKGTRARDAFIGMLFTTHDAALTYRFRSLQLTGRWVRQTYDQYSRDYFSVTASRPFGLIFE